LFINSLAKGLKVLSIFTEKEKELSLTEISQRLNMSKGSIQRVTYTLTSLGYLEKNEETKKYQLGLKVLTLGFTLLNSIELRQLAYPYMKALSDELNITVNLATLDKTEIVYLERIKVRQLLDINLYVGSRLPAFCTSMGKAILAFLPPKKFTEYLDHVELKPITIHSIVDKDRLKDELAKIRNKGYAINNEELVIGLRSIASPIINSDRVAIAAVNIPVLSSQVSLKELEEKYALHIVDLAKKISKAIGSRKGI